MSQNKQKEPEHSILLVDDDAEFLDGARRALLAHGISNVTTLQGGSKVLQALATGAHAVLLLDWVMPDLSGAYLLPEVVRQYPHKAVPYAKRTCQTEAITHENYFSSSDPKGFVYGSTKDFPDKISLSIMYAPPEMVLSDLLDI